MAEGKPLTTSWRRQVWTPVVDNIFFACITTPNNHHPRKWWLTTLLQASSSTPPTHHHHCYVTATNEPKKKKRGIVPLMVPFCPQHLPRHPNPISIYSLLILQTPSEKKDSKLFGHRCLSCHVTSDLLLISGSCHIVLFYINLYASKYYLFNITLPLRVRKFDGTTQ